MPLIKFCVNVVLLGAFEYEPYSKGGKNSPPLDSMLIKLL